MDFIECLLIYATYLTPGDIINIAYINHKTYDLLTTQSISEKIWKNFIPYFPNTTIICDHITTQNQPYLRLLNFNSKLIPELQYIKLNKVVDKYKIYHAGFDGYIQEIRSNNCKVVHGSELFRIITMYFLYIQGIIQFANFDCIVKKYFVTLKQYVHKNDAICYIQIL